MTKPGTVPATDQRPLSEVARHVIVPAGIKSTSWPKVRDTCHRLGWGFDGWQDGAGRLILSKRADGSYAADTIVISIPRQVGKTYLIACIIFALCLLEPGLKVIWTAHRKTTSAETFRQFEGMAKRPKVAPHVRQVLRGKGDESIWFLNGSSIEFGARESGFGRGRTDVDLLVFDEGQILPESTLEDMGATQNVAKNPLTFVMGTPPRPKDQGEFFTLLREEALSGDSDGTLYIETSADPGADPMDREQWRRANPSFPRRTTERAMLRLRKKLKNNDSWNREALGIWDELRKDYAFGAGKWELCALEADPGPHVDAIALAVSMDRLWASIGAAGGLEVDGVPRLMVAEVDRREGTGWLVPEALRIHQERGVPVVVARSAADLIPALEAAGFSVRSASNPGGNLVVARAGDSQDACAQIFDRVQQGTLAHAHHPELDRAVYGAHRRTINGERWVWDRKNSTADVSMLEAVTLAQWQASLSEPDYDVLESIY